MDMAVLEIEIGITVVPDFHEAVFDAEGVSVVLTDLMFGYFHGPVVEILPVEKLYPFRFGVVTGTCCCCQGDSDHKCLFHNFLKRKINNFVRGVEDTNKIRKPLCAGGPSWSLFFQTVVICTMAGFG